MRRLCGPPPAMVPWDLSTAQRMLLSHPGPCPGCVLGAQLCSALWVEGRRSLILRGYLPFGLKLLACEISLLTWSLQLLPTFTVCCVFWSFKTHDLDYFIKKQKGKLRH